MAISKQQKPHDYEGHGEEEYSGGGGSDPDCDSDMDTSYSILEETQSKLSHLSIRKKSQSRIDQALDNVAEVDEKSFEKVQKIIEAGQLEKLKVEECKVYLRKNGLRLTGNKDILIQRIKEHQEIVNGGGEKKYPVSSFVLNCKGDACTGDVVMFEQNVYEMYNIASRSASGPPCGTRIIAGRIVKESYGAAKQQHTFTIEVLWSKGEKPLPPLHPLLIKGRNLYRLKTLRQKWEDEGERCRVLMEKHLRGSVARSNRETRIQEKENRKMLRENRALKKEEANRNQSQLNPGLKVNVGVLTQQLGSFVNMGKVAHQPRHSSLPVDSGKLAIPAHKLAANMGGGAQQLAIQPQHSGSSILAMNMGSGSHSCQPAIVLQHSLPSIGEMKMKNRPQQLRIQPQKSKSAIDSKMMGSEPQQLAIKPQLSDSIKPTNHIAQQAAFYVESMKLRLQLKLQKDKRKIDYHDQVPYNSVKHRGILEVHQHRSDDFGSRLPNFSVIDHCSSFSKDPGHRHPLTSKHRCPMSPSHRKPLTSISHSSPMRTSHRQGYQQLQLCRYYAQGRCYYGDNCKFLHD